VPRKATNLALVVRRSVACNDVGDAKSALVVRLVQAHVNPGAVLLVPRLVDILGALLQQCRCDVVVDVLLEHVLVREGDLAVYILQPGRLAKADELVVDEAILDVVELVHVLHNGLTLILYTVLDKSISADGNPKANVAVNHKRRGREQGNEVREGGVGNEQALCGSVRISRRDTLDENLGKEGGEKKGSACEDKCASGNPKRSN
jgi:hypothetical protein